MMWIESAYMNCSHISTDMPTSARMGLYARTNGDVGPLFNWGRHKGLGRGVCCSDKDGGGELAYVQIISPTPSVPSVVKPPSLPHDLKCDVDGNGVSQKSKGILLSSHSESCASVCSNWASLSKSSNDKARWGYIERISDRVYEVVFPMKFSSITSAMYSDLYIRTASIYAREK